MFSRTRCLCLALAVLFPGAVGVAQEFPKTFDAIDAPIDGGDSPDSLESSPPVSSGLSAGVSDEPASSPLQFDPTTTSSAVRATPEQDDVPLPLNAAPLNAAGSPASTPLGPMANETVDIHYFIRKPVSETIRLPDGRVQTTLRQVYESRAAQIKIADDLEKLELPPEGRRAAVLAVTAARHPHLLKNLKEAQTPEERAAHSEALQENYTQHYAIETWWREKKLAELETRLETLRSQVTQRQESEEKYVSAAMTIAELWSDGIGILPPTPGRLPSGAPQQLGSEIQPGVPAAPSFLPGPVSTGPNPSTPTYRPSHYRDNVLPVPAPNRTAAPQFNSSAPTPVERARNN